MLDEIVGIRQLSKSGSDLSLVSRFKEPLNGSRTGCQYRWNPIGCTSLLPCHSRGCSHRDAIRTCYDPTGFNSSRVQSDVLNRVQESRGYLEVEIRKLLHDVSRVAEQSLGNAKRVREEGASAVQAALQRLRALECEAASVLETVAGG